MNENLKAILAAELIARKQAPISSSPAPPQNPFTPRAKKALVLASRCAAAKMSGYVGTEHILYGLIQEKEGVVARFLKSCGITLDDAGALINFEMNITEPEDPSQPQEPPLPTS